MGDVLIGVGVLLALVGPVLLVPAAWLVARFLARPILVRSGLDRPRARRWSWAVGVALVGGAVLGSHGVSRASFHRLCRSLGPPVVHRTERVSRVLVRPLFAYEARMFLSEGRFDFVEGERPGVAGFTRYSLGPDGAVREEAVAEAVSDIALEQTLTSTWWGSTVSQRTILVRSSGEELARASNAVFTGGPLSLFLGVYGMVSCPDPRTPEGAAGLRLYTDLVQVVLGGEAQL